MPYSRERNHDKQIAYLRKRAKEFLVFEKFLIDFPIYGGREWALRPRIIRSFGLQIRGAYPEMRKGRREDWYRNLNKEQKKVDLSKFNEWESEIGIIIKRKIKSL